MAEYTPAEAPWPIEEVWPDDLQLGDVINIAGNFPWLQITQIRDVPDNSPEWERKLGARLFLLSPVGEERTVTVTYDNHNVRAVFRRRKD